MQQKQDGTLRDILSKLNEMNEVKEFMEETNTFRPSVSSLGQKEF